MGGNVGKTFVKYVSLNIIGMITASALVFIDAIFISIALGADGLTAISLTAPIFSIVFGLGLMLGEGGGSKYAANMAVEKEEKANAFFTLSIKTCLMIAVPLVVIGLLFAEPLSMFLGADAYIMPEVSAYARVLLAFSPAIMLYYALESFVRNDGTPGTATISSVILYATNIALNYVFIILLDLRMLGSGLATSIAALFALGYLLYHWRKKARFHFAAVFAAGKKRAAIFSIGAPSFLGNILFGLTILAFNWVFLQHLGNIGVAAFGIVSTLATVVFAIFIGIAQGMQPMASHFYGKRDAENLYKVLKYAILTGVGFAILFIAAVFLFTEPLVSVLNQEQDMVLAAELAALAAGGARIYFIGFVFAGITLASTYFLAATGAPKRALVLSALQNGGIILFMLALAYQGGVTGIWASYPTFELPLALLSLFFLARVHRMHRRLFFTTC
ncbi:MAG: MATE family efflux transporter [Oscillospiraceae bacterium]|nr:MATE family efflux transporter [Oscillospiraceae bacterium]